MPVTLSAPANAAPKAKPPTCAKYAVESADEKRSPSRTCCASQMGSMTYAGAQKVPRKRMKSQ